MSPCLPPSRKPRVAYARGSFLNPFEAQYLLPLQDDFDITALMPRSHRYDVSTLGLPVRTLNCADYFNNLLPRRIGRFRVPNLLKRFGAEERVFGLDAALPGFDLVHAAEQTFYSSYQIALRKARFDYRLITIQDEINPFWYENNPRTMRRAALVRERTDLFIARTARARAALIKEGVEEDRIQVIGHGVDAERFQPGQRSEQLCRQWNIAPDQFVVLFVGRLVWEKGIFALADAARELLADERFRALNPVFVLAGDGEERGALERRLQLLGVADAFRLVGNQAYEQLPQVHRLADVFVLPSIATRSVQEQFGIVLIEAMASGSAVLATHCGAIDEVVGDTARLVQPNDAYRLAGALRQLALDPAVRWDLGTRARARVTRLFRSELISAKLADAYRRVLSLQPLPAAQSAPAEAMPGLRPPTPRSAISA